MLVISNIIEHDEVSRQGMGGNSAVGEQGTISVGVDYTAIVVGKTRRDWPISAGRGKRKLGAKSNHSPGSIVF